MALYKSTYHHKIYRDFHAIEASAYRQIIRFFEEHEARIKELDFEEYFEMLTTYVGALFETGAYRNFLLMVDVLIEITIEQNILTYKGEDLYQNLLFRKAAALYNLMQYDRADYILRELIKMDPCHGDSVRLLKKCLRRKQPRFVHRARATAILLFLFSALVISLEVLLIRPFYLQYTGAFETFRNLLFLLGCGILIGSDLIHRWRVEKEVNDYSSAVRKSKSIFSDPD